MARVLRLDACERRLLLEALTLLSAGSLLLKYGPGKLTMKLIQRASTEGIRPADAELALDVAAAVEAAALQVPFSTCLARALTGWVMLTRRHGGATLRLGIQRGSAREIAAHAWLECEGQRVIGGETAHEYTAFTFP